MKNKGFVLLGVFIFCMTLGLKDAMAAAATDVACKAPCINSFEIQDGQVTSTDIADGAVTDAKITGPISSSKIQKHANVIVVAKSGGDFTSIQAAIDSITPTADNPYLIKVMPGTYTESITLKSYIHLQGAGRDVTTIQAPSGSLAAITLNTLTNVTIFGFTIKGERLVINSNSSSSTIVGNNISTTGDGSAGIYVVFGTSTISGNIIAGNGTGVHVYYSSPLITENIITGNRYSGIVTSTSSSPTITYNKITGNGVTTSSFDLYMFDTSSTPHISFNVYDTIGGDSGGVGLYNVKSDGSPAPAP